MNDAVLQSIIGTDKRNPYIQVLQRVGGGGCTSESPSDDSEGERFR